MNTEISNSVCLTNSDGFELSQRAGKLMAASTLMPDTFKGNLPNCVIALNLASRLGADPLLVAQNLYVVHGRPAWSAQFLIACWNQSGRYSSIKYEFFGEKGTDDYGCRAVSKELATGEAIVGPDVTIALAKEEGWYNRNGSKWKTSLRDLMLRYRAATFLIRTTAPELSMGLQTAEEMHDVYDAEPRGGSFEVISDINERIARSATQTPADVGISESSVSGTVESVDTETGEITDPFAELRADPEYADWCAAVESKQTIGELASLMNSMDKKTKAAMHAFLESQQDRIKGKAAA